MLRTKPTALGRCFFLNEEGGGFEPPDPCGSAVFKTAALDLYAIPPSAPIFLDAVAELYHL